MAQEQLRIDHDHNAIDIMDAVNALLKKYGLVFEDDNLDHDGYLIYHLDFFSDPQLAENWR